MDTADKIQAIPMLLAEQEPEAELKRGYQLGIYTLLEQIGKGGEAAVWSGFDNLRKRIVAVKVISLDQSDPVAASLVPANFEREVHLVASLEHPHILPMYEFGMAESFSYFVMAYKGVGTLANWIKIGPLSLVEIAKMTQQVLSALAYLHQRGIVHRDIKPSNVLLDSQKRAYLADFGLAKRLSQSTRVLHTGRGTGPYAPYEQQASDSITMQSDIFSVGVVLYEMLTGQLPWEAQFSLASMQKKGGEVLPDPRMLNPNCPQEITEVLRWFTSFRWQERPQSAESAYAAFYKALPPQVQQQVGESLLLKPEREEVVLAQDASHYLDVYQFDWQEEMPYPASLTHLAFVEAYYNRFQSALDEKTLRFLLRGALVHDYQLAHWWKLADPALRWQVSLAALAGESDDVMARVLSLLLREPAGVVPTAVAGSASLEKLIDLATHAKEWRLRRDSLNALAHLLPQASAWQPVGISHRGDARLAQLALEEGTQARLAVIILGALQSETAVQTLLQAYETGSRSQSLNVLQQIWERAGSLPREVPPAIRARLWGRWLQERLLDDPEGLSASRLLIGFGAALLVSLMLGLGLFAIPQGQTQDVLMLPYEPSGIVTIVEVDDESLAQYGRWDQWPRSLHAELITQLQAAGTKTIVFDFVFASETADDARLAEVMAAAGNVVQPLLVQGDAFHDLTGRLRYTGRVLPQPEFVDAGAGLGHTSILHDADGYIRRTPTLVAIDGQEYESLAMVTLHNYLGSASDELAVVENGRLSLLGRQIPVDEDGEMRIYYAGPPAEAAQSTFPMVSYQDVLAGTAPEELLRGKIVLVGITATAEPDRYLTPVSDGRPMYGVEILANVIESIWSERFVRVPGTAVQVLILWGLGLLVGLVCTRPVTGFVLAFSIAAFYFLLAGWLFDLTGIMLDLFFPFLAIAFSYSMVTVYRYAVEVRRRRQIVSLFAGSVTPATAQATVDAVKQGKLDLSGQEQELSVLLCEMRGYKEYAVNHDPADVLAMMTFFREKMVQAVLALEGTVIRAEQGQTMAVFNAPLPQGDHAWRAVQAAQLLQKDMAQQYDMLPDDHVYREIQLAFVVNTGRAVVGYAGAGERSTFTVLGEAVTLADYLIVEANAGQILLGEQSYTETAESVTAVPLKPLRLKEWADAVPVYAIDLYEDGEEQMKAEANPLVTNR
ncbi:MAG: CHASE2 domain-containing protein [Anaerolineaceae bacterium]|nr:CHASE2 domain-containing protein [Anaerolineaceae bacterium]